MTDEEKKVPEEKMFCKKECDLGRFFTLTASIFLGVLLAILVAAALLRPNCHCKGRMMPPPPVMMERQMPPMGQFAPPAYGGHHFRGHGAHPDFGQRPDFQADNAPARK